MNLPLVPAIAGGRAALLLLAVLVYAAPASADEQSDPYSATVKVDATADNPADARHVARLDGQRRALTEVIDRLSGTTDAKLPKLDDDAVTDLVDSFEVADEHMSAVRYLADYTFHFRAAKIRRLMHDADIAPAAAAGKPVIVLPVYQDGAATVLWDDPNPWRDAWAQRPAGAGPIRLDVPLAGIGALTTIDAEQALAGQSDALTAIAQHNGGDEAIVALARARRQDGRVAGLDVSIKRYRLGQLAGSQNESLDANPGESENDFIKRAADATAADIASGTNKTAATTPDQQASLTAAVPITSLGDWVQLRQKLAAVPGVRKVDLLSLSREEAKIEITYGGAPDQLKSSLADAGLDLGGGDPVWQLQPSAAASAH